MYVLSTRPRSFYGISPKTEGYAADWFVRPHTGVLYPETHTTSTIITGNGLHGRTAVPEATGGRRRHSSCGLSVCQPRHHLSPDPSVPTADQRPSPTVQTTHQWVLAQKSTNQGKRWAKLTFETHSDLNHFVLHFVAKFNRHPQCL